MTNTANDFQAFPLVDLFDHPEAHRDFLRIVSIPEDEDYINIRQGASPNDQWVALSEGESLLVTGMGPGPEFTVAFATVHQWSGPIEVSRGVMVASVPPTNLAFRTHGTETAHNHPNDLNGHRHIGVYEVCDSTAEYWINV